MAPADIAGVFVTHIHLDHAGGAGWWACEGVPVYVHPSGAKHLIAPQRLEESSRMVYGGAFDELWGGLTAAPAESVRVIEDGQQVTVAGLSVQAVDTPGHAFHHHAFEVDGVVFSGDAAGVRLEQSGYFSVASAPPQFHLQHTLDSLDRLASLSCRELYLTHFGRVDDPAAHFREYRDSVELNAEFVRARLAEGMDSESLQVAYEAFQLEQAFRAPIAHSLFENYQSVNGSAMCADGIRIFWEKHNQPSS